MFVSERIGYGFDKGGGYVVRLSMAVDPSSRSGMKRRRELVWAELMDYGIRLV